MKAKADYRWVGTIPNGLLYSTLKFIDVGHVNAHRLNGNTVICLDPKQYIASTCISERRDMGHEVFSC